MMIFNKKLYFLKCLGVVLLSMVSSMALASAMGVSAPISQSAILNQMMRQQSYNSQKSGTEEPVYGVTIDAVDHLASITQALSALPYKPTTRIVFDEYMPASNYTKAVNQIHNVSYIMGELLDSSAMKKYSVNAFEKRVRDYVDSPFSHEVDIWEIGNEINGNWLGKTSDVVAKMTYAYHYVKQNGGKTALTLYYNEGCASNKAHEMFNWVQNNVPSDMKQNLDYVLVSFYPDQCNFEQPNWQQVFTKLHQIFPNAKLGFGEIGTSNDNSSKSSKVKILQEYYGLDITVPNYIGGYFWWYFKEDMVPDTKSLWSILKQAMINEHNNFA